MFFEDEEHSSKISRAKSTTSEEEEQLYDVEAVVARRNVQGVEKMLVKWMGYPWLESTWEIRYTSIYIYHL